MEGSGFTLPMAQGGEQQPWNAFIRFRGSPFFTSSHQCNLPEASGITVKDHLPLVTKHFSDQVHHLKCYILYLAGQLAGSPLSFFQRLTVSTSRRRVKGTMVLICLENVGQSPVVCGLFSARQMGTLLQELQLLHQEHTIL